MIIWINIEIKRIKYRLSQSKTKLKDQTNENTKLRNDLTDSQQNNKCLQDQLKTATVLIQKIANAQDYQTCIKTIDNV